jgi:hypothetical protein
VNKRGTPPIAITGRLPPGALPGMARPSPESVIGCGVKRAPWRRPAGVTAAARGVVSVKRDSFARQLIPPLAALKGW